MDRERYGNQNLEDFFAGLSKRPERKAYFCVFDKSSDEINGFLCKYFDAARKCGVVIEGKIGNPTEGNLAYYEEMMGMEFQMSLGFISSGINKWLPRMKASQRESVACAVYDSLESLRKSGKTENMLKNAYIKFMCWLYYKFERVVGLDMIVIPGETRADVISGIIADEAAIGMVNSKTTAVRLIPAIGRKVGETLDFGGLLGEGPVMPVNQTSDAVFINRGGRIPAPLQALKN